MNDSGAFISLDFNHALADLPNGYVEGVFRGRKWGSTIKRSDDGRRVWLYAEEFGGTGVVSFNFYMVSPERAILKPCEMSPEKVTEFVIGFVPRVSCRSNPPCYLSSRETM